MNVTENTKPMPLLLIEDDGADCIEFKNYSATRTDIKFVGMTGCASEGLTKVQTMMPEGIILDLELHWGTGSGFDFLAGLEKFNLKQRPIIIVTTNISSKIVYNKIRKHGVDVIFYKKQSDYSVEMVLNHMVAMRDSWLEEQLSGVPEHLRTMESPDARHKRIMDIIDTEMNKIGVSVSYKGYRYIQNSIYKLINKDQNNSEAVIQQVADEHKSPYINVFRAMDSAIKRAWRISNIDDLEKHYTAQINSNTGVPTPNEFIHYYADKISKII
jgi:DNA-binding NarL/FixJ family response regulator